MFHQDHFRTPLPPDRAAALFSEAVQTIEISISRFCNRRCPYCPNSQVDRLSNRSVMADALFYNIMRQLCRIDYAAGIHINRYNEPLADRGYALRRIREIKAFLPRCSITVFTNGDYLDASYVRDLGELGVTAMLATVHEAPTGTSFADLLQDQDRRMAKLGLPFFYQMNSTNNVRTAHVNSGSAMAFTYMAQDFHRRDENGVLWMQDRGQALDVAKGMQRDTPCFMPFVQMQIEWDGELLPCCQIQPDAFDPGQYSLGRLTETSDIFQAWTTPAYVQWRRDLFSYAIKKSPCATCNYGGFCEESPEKRALIEQWRAGLGLAEARQGEFATTIQAGTPAKDRSLEPLF
jgi:radical SAM protein with 4Fe4S-binding SPASM domain